jgi:hypothetical protein
LLKRCGQGAFCGRDVRSPLGMVNDLGVVGLGVVGEIGVGDRTG